MRRVKPVSSSNFNESTLWQTKQTFQQQHRQRTLRRLLNPARPRRVSVALAAAVDAAASVAAADLAADAVRATTRTRVTMD